MWVQWDPKAGRLPPTRDENYGFDHIYIRRRDGWAFWKRLSMVDWTHVGISSDILEYNLELAKDSQPRYD